MSIDKAIMQAFPLLAVPTTNDAPPAAAFGIRYLVSRCGLLREINLPWIRVVHSIAKSNLPLPYGTVNEAVQLKCGRIPADLLRTFLRDARDAFPNEVAAALLWSEHSGQWRYALREGTFASPGMISFNEVTLLEGEHLVIDVHSHGAHDAFFSELDDKDDAGAMKISLVLGNIDRDMPSSKMRLCMAGHTIQPAYLGADGTIGVPS